MTMQKAGDLSTKYLEWAKAQQQKTDGEKRDDKTKNYSVPLQGRALVEMLRPHPSGSHEMGDGQDPE